MKSSEKSMSSNGMTKKAASRQQTSEAMRDLFEDSLQDIYWAEKALTKALPKMVKNATAEDLVTALNDHLSVTERQVKRLEEVFTKIGAKAQAKKCPAMEGLIKEAEEIMESADDDMVRDAGIIAAGQKVEHYEIATYGTLCAFAKVLGENDAAELLQQTLSEEKEADEKLTEVAEACVNLEAAGAH